MVAGVAGGMAQYLGIDPALVRIVWLALLVMGAGILLYVIAWIAIPEADAGTEAPRPVATARPTVRRDTTRLVLGAVLVIGGATMLARRYLPWMKDLLLPAVLIAVGAGVIVYSLKK
jgi:phage shock protein C